jgi:hypothetical protein
LTDTLIPTELEKDRARPSAGRFCFLVSSSDRARDVFEIVFQNAEAIWRDCDWPRFVGFTSKWPDIYGFKTLAAKGPSHWRQEVTEYLDGLPEQIEYVLRIDEDALFLSPVDGKKLNEIADLMVGNNLSYVSLVPLRRNLPGRVIEYFRRKRNGQPLRLISVSEPYYSSVAVAIWKRSYLRSLLQQSGNIWEFEHTITNEPHYAVWEPVLDQDQLVIKGRWFFRARRQLARQGLSLNQSQREFQTLRSWFRSLREQIVFQLVGFTSFRLRRRFNRVPGLPRDLVENQRTSKKSRDRRFVHTGQQNG